MHYIKNILKKYKEKIRLRNQNCNHLITQIDLALTEAHDLFVNTSDFIEPAKAQEWIHQNALLLQALEEKQIKNLKKAFRYKLLFQKQIELQQLKSSLKKEISIHNEQVASAKIENIYRFIGEVEGRKLDRQQLICIAKEAHNHLVIAGAGTGKTTTIVGKIKYLLQSHTYKPDDILVLSFTNASATEMCERIQKETGYHIRATTFHQFALTIIKETETILPKITQVSLPKYIKEQLEINMKNESYLNLLNTYLLYHRIPTKSEFTFKNQAEYNEYLKQYPPTTIRNEKVKSYGEMDIANFLIQNGITYIYEHPYIIDTRTDEYEQYNPDFYLPDYHIYIEYFAINREGEAPSYFTGQNGKTGTQQYQESMKWKRQIHQTYNTTMIECYAYEKLEGNLLDCLKDKLQEKKVVLTPKSTEELWEQVIKNDATILDGLVELFETLINLIKSNHFTISDVRERNQSHGNGQANNDILTLVEPLFDAYNQYLQIHNEIDFNDMINKATKYVKTGKYHHPYQYVMVDEYQDISKARFSLLHEMRKTNNFGLFCVGDDWQSIYRFTGSDIGFLLHFEKYWGATEISMIETTYRFPQKMCEMSGNFIMQNPAQIKKNIHSEAISRGFPLGEINGYTDKYAINFMLKRLDNLPKNSTVFFIGRYTFDFNLLKDNGLFTWNYHNINKTITVIYKKRPDLKMSFITAHKSKGLQADYVFIINNKKSKMGFPSQIQDADILNLLLDNCDQYPYAEERRLFYVALTRAKIKTFLVTITDHESEFVLELKNNYGNKIKMEAFECPLCGGQLSKKNGPYGEFFGCSNYKTIGCTYTREFKKVEK